MINKKIKDYILNYNLPQYAQLLPKSAWVYILHIGSNDITKTSCDNVSAEDLAQRISNIAKKKTGLLGVSSIAISSILMKKIVNY